MATTTLSVYPSMDTTGFVSDPSIMLDFLMTDFFASDISQSTLYMNKTVSLTGILQRNVGRVFSAVADIQESLTTYLNRYYDSVDVQVSTDANVTTSAFCTISIRIIFQVENTVSNPHLFDLSVEDSKLVKYLKVLNS